MLRQKRTRRLKIAIAFRQLIYHASLVGDASLGPHKKDAVPLVFLPHVSTLAPPRQGADRLDAGLTARRHHDAQDIGPYNRPVRLGIRDMQTPARPLGPAEQAAPRQAGHHAGVRILVKVRLPAALARLTRRPRPVAGDPVKVVGPPQAGVPVA